MKKVIIIAIILSTLLFAFAIYNCIFGNIIEGILNFIALGVIIYAVLKEAAQILRLLHIEELRELQTKINEAIVAVQAIIADPKTDHRLGKVGR